MFLAWAMDDAWFELVADFQQWYGIDIFELDLHTEELTRDVERAAILAAQLPGASRTRRKANPLNSVDVKEQLLRRIDTDLQAIACGLGGGEVQPFEFEGETAQAERIARRNVQLSRRTAERFGLKGLEATIG